MRSRLFRRAKAAAIKRKKQAIEKGFPEKKRHPATKRRLRAYLEA